MGRSLHGFPEWYTHYTCTPWVIPYWSSGIIGLSDDFRDEIESAYPDPDGLCFDGFFKGVNETYHDRSTYTNDTYVEDINLDTISSFIINSSNSSSSDDPFFVFWAAYTPHWPIVNPPDNGNANYSVCANITNAGRLSLCKMMQYLDYEIESLVNTLKENDLWNNTIIVFSSDNGGETSNNNGTNQFDPWFGNGYATNLPFRGKKRASFEGGVHSAAFIAGGYLPNNIYGLTYDNLISIEDWYSTFIGVADINITSIDELNGIELNSFDAWDSITYTFEA